MKNKLLIMFLASALTFSNVLPTFALPNDTETEEQAEEETNEDLEEDDTLFVDEEEDQAEDEETDSEEVPGWLTAEPIISTTKDEVNNSQLVFSCIMPEYFNLGTYVEVVNNETGNLYRMIATATNGYKNVMFLPEGNYMVVGVGIVGDDNGDYPMSPIEDFELKQGVMKEISSTLMNYDEIQQEAYKRMGLLEGVTEADPEVLETQEDESTGNNESLALVEPWRMITALNDGAGAISLSGTPNRKFDLVVEIMESGSTENGEFRYSVDGGETWSENIVIKSRFVIMGIDETDKVSYGLELNFESDQHYIQGDKYVYAAEHEYATSSTETMNVGKGGIRVTTNGTIYGEEIDLRVVITKTGTKEQAFFKYSLNDGLTYSESIPIPQSGMYDIVVNKGNEKTGVPVQLITLTFWDEPGKFMVGDSWKATIKTEKIPRDYTPYAIGFVFALAFIIILVFFWFQNMRDKANEYTLNVYEKASIVDTPNKKRKKE